MSVIEEKKALRTFIRKKERTLDPVYKAESSEAICRHLLALDEYKSAKVVFAFAGTEKEIDTSLFMNETIAAGKTLILPRCAAEHAIDLCVVRSMDDPGGGRLRHFRAEEELRARHRGGHRLRRRALPVVRPQGPPSRSGRRVL